MKYGRFRGVRARYSISKVLAAAILLAVVHQAAWAVNYNFTLKSEDTHGVPITGIDIAFTLNNIEQSPLTTEYQGTYLASTPIGLVAPDTALNRPFFGWKTLGVVFSQTPAYSFNIGANFELIAVYGDPVYILSVTSSPDIDIRMLNEDIEEFFTPFERQFTEQNTEAIVRAPETYNNRPFARWLLDGKFYSDFHVAYVTMDDSHSLEAQYGEGGITVKIFPKGARKGGARWRVDGGAWMKKGQTVSGLKVGDHIVEFKPVPGYTTPKKRKVPVVADGTRLIRTHYFEP